MQRVNAVVTLASFINNSRVFQRPCTFARQQIHKLPYCSKFIPKSTYATMSYGTTERGCPNSLEYRMFISKFRLYTLIYNHIKVENISKEIL